MDTFWLKVVVVAILIVAVFVGIATLISPKPSADETPAKTIYDMAKEDKQKLLAEPSAKDFDQERQRESEPLQEPAETQQPEEIEPQQQVESVVLYFKPLSQIEQIEAERIMQTVPSWRSIGRLPMTGYTAMVQSCRQLMNRFPGSKYDYMGRRALANIPEHYWARYHITEEEVSLEKFKQQRSGTEPYEITQED